MTYDSQGGSTVTDGDTTTTTGGSITTLPTDPTRTGYTFTGWYTEASGGIQITACSAAHGQPADFTLYAPVDRKQRYDSHGGGNGDRWRTTTAHLRIDNHTAKPIPTQMATGYMLLRWYTDGHGVLDGARSLAGTALNQTSDFTLYRLNGHNALF